MKKILFLATLFTLSNYSIAMDNIHPRQQKFVVCSKLQGARADSTEKIDHCANVDLEVGCYCGPKHQVHALLDKSNNNNMHERRSNKF